MPNGYEQKNKDNKKKYIIRYFYNFIRPFQRALVHKMP